MSNPTTGFMCKNANGIYQDLSGIFLPLSLGTSIGYNTGFKVAGHGDLSQIFSSISSGNKNTFNTGYTVNGVDLTNIFAMTSIFVVSNMLPSYYSQTYKNNNYVIVFTNPNNSSGDASNNITFTVSVKNVNIIVVGGGGSGSGGNTSEVAGGGGGAGGQVLQLTNQTLAAGTYPVQIGGGGQGIQGSTGNAGGISYFSNIVISSGGNPGTNVINTGLGVGGEGINSGSGGTGGTFSGTASENGSPGVTVSTIDGNSYTFGGGGGGGSYDGQRSSSVGGLGGGGGGGFETLANNNQPYTGPNNISYEVSSFIDGQGLQSTGGAGAGGNSNNSDNATGGDNGGSGIVVISFQYP